MKNKLMVLTTVILAGFVISCTTIQNFSGAEQISPQVFNLVQDMIFEVVQKKPVEDSLTYDKELDWDTVPFNIRNDDYYSIGTAFVISNTELITAFHVLGFWSMVYDTYFIRDTQGNVYEIDQIAGGSNEKDFITFTVKGKNFDKYFQFERNYEIGTPVFSIGNALGEGIIIRNGLVLGTVPEDDSGRWNWLKSSADVNPGNSGGPLITPDGKVIALISSRRDNILYSIPAEVILDNDRSFLYFRDKYRYSHYLLSNNLRQIFETQIPLPNTFIAIRQTLQKSYNTFNNTAMTTLFEQAPEYLTGPNNYELLNSSLYNNFPQVSFIDYDDDNWILSRFEGRSYILENDGRLLHTMNNDFNFYKFKKPNTVSLEEINTNPKYIMDIILQNIRTDRTLWSHDRYRILSYGEPVSTGVYKDSLGRTWITAYWIIEYEDQVQIMYILPQPNGPTVITTKRYSGSLNSYEWDMRKTCDHLFVAYEGSFEEWSEFLSIERFVPEFLKDMRFEWNREEKRFSFSSNIYSIIADSEVLGWNDKSELFLAPSWYRHNDEIEFGIRKIWFSQDQRRRATIYFERNVKPDLKLGTNAIENWNDIAQGKSPYNENPVISPNGNHGSISGLINAKNIDEQTVFTLYLSVEEPQDEENLTLRFNAMKNGIEISVDNKQEE